METECSLIILSDLSRAVPFAEMNDIKSYKMHALWSTGTRGGQVNSGLQ